MLVRNENPRGCNQYTGPGCAIGEEWTPEPPDLDKIKDDQQFMIQLPSLKQREIYRMGEVGDEDQPDVMHEVYKNPSFDTVESLVRKSLKPMQVKGEGTVKGLAYKGNVYVFPTRDGAGYAVTHGDVYYGLTGHKGESSHTRAFQVVPDAGGVFVRAYAGVAGSDPEIKQWVAKNHFAANSLLDLGGLKKSILANVGRFAFATSPEKLKAFQNWLKQQFKAYISGKSQKELWRKFIESAYRRGAGRAFDDTRMRKLHRTHPEFFTPESQGSLRDFYAGTKEEFLRSAFGHPANVDEVKMLVSRSFDELQGVTTDMSIRMSRILGDGFARGEHPRRIASQMADVVGLSLSRARLIATTEFSRAHAQGQLMALKKSGVTHVGVAVEYKTSGMPTGTCKGCVCERCAYLEGIVLKIEEANGIIPVHPNAVFAGSTFVPYGECSELVRARYSGPAIVLSLGSGEYRTTIGPNHPILTSRGMKRAADIHKGDKILYDLRHDDSALRSKSNLKEIPFIENAFESCLSVGAHTAITTSTSDLHGDRIFCLGEVKAVTPTRGLLGVFDPSGIEHLHEELLARPDSESKTVAGPCPGLFGAWTVMLPSSGSMCGADSWVFADYHVWLQVTEVTEEKFEGYAFDASTHYSLYCNNGLVVKNCLCAWLPANVGESDEYQVREFDEIAAALEAAEIEDVDLDEERPEPVIPPMRRRNVENIREKFEAGKPADVQPTLTGLLRTLDGSFYKQLPTELLEISRELTQCKTSNSLPQNGAY